MGQPWVGSESSKFIETNGRSWKALASHWVPEQGNNSKNIIQTTTPKEIEVFLLLIGNLWFCVPWWSLHPLQYPNRVLAIKLWVYWRWMQFCFFKEGNVKCKNNNFNHVLSTLSLFIEIFGWMLQVLTYKSRFSICSSRTWKLLRELNYFGLILYGVC